MEIHNRAHKTYLSGAFPVIARFVCTSWQSHSVLSCCWAGCPIVTAHELGHQFGLKDEYCSCPGLGICDEAPNALQAGLGCDASGDCCWEDARIFGITLTDSCPLGYTEYGCFKCCHGNKNALGGRSIMSWADAEGPRAHDITSLQHLASKLRCD